MRLLVGLMVISMISSGIGCGEAEQEEFECEASRLALDFDEQSQFGYSAKQALEEVELSGQAELEWYDDTGSVTEIDWDISENAAEVYQFEESLPPEAEGTGLICDAEYVEIAAVVEIETEDEKLAETLDLELRAVEDDRIEYASVQPLGEMQGTFSPENVSDQALVRIRGWLTSEESGGNVELNQYYDEPGDGAQEGIPWEIIAKWPADD